MHADSSDHGHECSSCGDPRVGGARLGFVDDAQKQRLMSDIVDASSISRIS
jgi:hypothetical protein